MNRQLKTAAESLQKAIKANKSGTTEESPVSTLDIYKLDTMKNVEESVSRIIVLRMY